jgi:hypothetical protein
MNGQGESEDWKHRTMFAEQGPERPGISGFPGIGYKNLDGNLEQSLFELGPKGY